MSWTCRFCESNNDSASEICQNCEMSKIVSDEVGKHISQFHSSSNNYRSILKQTEYASQYGFAVAEKREAIVFHKKECSKSLSRIYLIIILVLLFSIVPLACVHLLNVSIWHVLLTNFLVVSLLFSLINFFLKDYRYHIGEIRNQQNEITDLAIALILDNKNIIDHIFEQRKASNEAIRKSQVPDNPNNLLKKISEFLFQTNKNSAQ